MAMYGANCGISYPHTSNNLGDGNEDLLSTYSMLSPTGFKDMASFKKHVMDCYNGFVARSSDHHQYMAFTNVSRKWFSKIDALCEGRTSLPSMVVLYDATEEVLIVKIMLGAHHNSARIQFHDMLQGKFVQLAVGQRILSAGSTQFGDPAGRCKEADSAYIPTGRHSDDFPSLVVEVGVSESLQMLKNDAWHWLTQSGGQTWIVIIIHIDTISRKILLERWESIDNGRPRRTTVAYPPLLPRMIQSLELVAGVQYAGDALEIPAVKVFDVVPNNLPNGEFVFTGNELQHFSDHFWAQF